MLASSLPPEEVMALYPSPCPVCNRCYCDHTPAERGQTIQEIYRDATPEEEARWQKEQDAQLKVLAEQHPELFAKKPE